jgi:hypothetical protein
VGGWGVVWCARCVLQTQILVYRAAHGSCPTSRFVRVSAGDRDQRSVVLVLLGSARRARGWTRRAYAAVLRREAPASASGVWASGVWCSIVIVDVGQNASFVVRCHAGRSAALVPCAVLRRGGGPCFAFRVIETQCERWLCALASSRIFLLVGRCAAGTVAAGTLRVLGMAMRFVVARARVQVLKSEVVV